MGIFFIERTGSFRCLGVPRGHELVLVFFFLLVSFFFFAPSTYPYLHFLPSPLGINVVLFPQSTYVVLHDDSWVVGGVIWLSTSVKRKGRKEKKKTSSSVQGSTVVKPCGAFIYPFIF